MSEPLGVYGMTRKTSSSAYERYVSSPIASPISSPGRLSSSKFTTSEGISLDGSSPKSYSSHSSGCATADSVTYSDRCIPSRLSSNLEDAFEIMGDTERDRQMSLKSEVAHENQGVMNNLLRAELLGQRLVSSKLDPEGAFASSGSLSPGSPTLQWASSRTTQQPQTNILVYKSFSSRPSNVGPYHSAASDLSSQPFGSKSPTGQRLSAGQRKISKVPYKVLDAPNLQDDYYLNLVDWSSSNVLSVALGPCVYLWSACTSKVSKLCELGATVDETVTSISWSLTGNQIAVGTSTGQVQIWDAARCTKIRSLAHHGSRVGSLAWSSTLLASGGRDRNIYLQDIRVRSRDDHSTSEPSVVQQLSMHKQEVCGLKWSFDERMLASGGNDNKLFVWLPQQGDSSTPLCRFDDHSAAVKAVAWSPHQHGLLASGGGTADRHIRFWNALSGAPLHRIDTGSQVCNLMWSRNVNEIVSTHGYSLNQIIVWKYPSMQKLTTLTGHSLRVLYLAMSPDGQSVVTGAGDETLRFWNLFPGPASSLSRAGPSALIPTGADIR